MYTLHIANKNYSSWSLRPWVLMRELGIDFEELMHVFEPTNWEEFRTFSPSGTVPCLWDDEIRVWDSLAIIEYLAEIHPGVWPKDRIARAWARSATTEMHAGFPALRTQCSMTCGQRISLHEMPPVLVRDIERIDELWREGLERFGGPFLAGDEFTAVDAFFTPVAFRIQTYRLAVSGTAMAYAQRLLALPSMQDWYAQALAETWRDTPHDIEVQAWGTVAADLRES